MMDKDLSLKLYRSMYLIRKTEETIQQYYSEDEMKTPMHMSMGAEAIDAGVCLALQPEDQVLGTYRSHGIYLAKTGETDRFFAEMYGKVTGTAKGKAGSMHLISKAHGLIGTSAIVASHIPLAVGAAFANKTQKNGRVVAVFFGDGAIDEGVFWESINMACLKKLPVVFVCQDNGYAVHIPAAARHGYQAIGRIIEQFDINVLQSSSTDVEEIHDLTLQALRVMRENGKPCFLHLKYYRYLEHVGVNQDFQSGYRAREEAEEWLARDPVRLQRQKLLGVVDEETISALEDAVTLQINASISQAKRDPLPETCVILEDVLA